MNYKTLLIRTVSIMFVCVSVGTTVYSQELELKEVNLTVYNQNFALVRDLRMLNLKKGLNTIKFIDIAAQIEPASVNFKSLTSPVGCNILEQNFEYDLVNSDKLFQKYIDQEIKVMTKDNNLYQGYLSSYDSNQLVLTKDKITGPVFMVNRENVRNTEFPQLPEGLITKPTLMWLLNNEKEGQHSVEVSYLTQGINWLADYVATISPDDKNVSLNGWVTIDNRSGTSYEDAALKLVAGDVNRVKETPEYEMARGTVLMQSLKQEPQFEEKQFFEYHLYTLQRKTTLENNQTKQISLFAVPKVSVEKVYTYDGALYRWYYYDDWQRQKCNKKIGVNLELKNDEKNGLGIPLPKGKVKVYKADTDKTLQFIGEDQIDHTAKNEKLTIFLGNVFDVVGERKITDHKQIMSIMGMGYRDSYEIILRNHKKEPVTVKVIERQWADWKVVSSSHKYNKKDANTLEFEVTVPSDGEEKVTYTAEYKF